MDSGFDPTEYFPLVLPIWVRIPHLPLHYWNLESLETIGNKLGKYIDRTERKDQYSSARICVEVYLEIGLPEAIKLTVVEWSHIQYLDYEQLPFNCRYCHGYGHFARNCKKKSEEDLEKRRLISGLKFRNRVFPIRTIERKEKKERPRMEPLMMGRSFLKHRL